MSKIIPYLIIGLCLCAGLVYLLNGCESRRGPDNTSNKIFVDSIINKAKEDSIIAKKIVTHLTDSLGQLRRENDSLETTQKKKEGLVNTAGRQILGLISRIDSLKIANDVSGQLKGCDSLRQLYEDAAKIVGGYEYISDSLIDRLKLERHLSDSVKNYLWGMFTDANNSLFSIGLKYDKLDADYKKLNGKPKRFSIGPSAGAFITNKGVGYGAGITISYTIIKF